MKPGEDKPLAWLHGEIKSPPFTSAARVEAGILLRRLQKGDSIGLPHSRPMPTIGSGVHELRIRDAKIAWRIFYYLGDEAVVILEVAEKKTQATPKHVIQTCQKRLRQYRAFEQRRSES